MARKLQNKITGTFCSQIVQSRQIVKTITFENASKVYKTRKEMAIYINLHSLAVCKRMNYSSFKTEMLIAIVSSQYIQPTLYRVLAATGERRCLYQYLPGWRFVAIY